MVNEIQGLAPAGAPILVALLGTWLTVYLLRLRRWWQLAGAMGLRFHAGWVVGQDRMEGHFQGQPVLIYRTTHGPSWWRQTYTLLQVQGDQQESPWPVRVALERKGALSALGGGAPEEGLTGDAEFDRLFWVRGAPAEHIPAALPARLRQVLVELLPRGPELELGPRGVGLRLDGWLTDGELLHRLLQALVLAAEQARAIAPVGSAERPAVGGEAGPGPL